MDDKLAQIIEFDSEGGLLDFKREEYILGGKYGKKYEFIKDVMAFANHPSNDDKFIIIGVEEQNGTADKFIPFEKITDQSKYQSLVDDNVEPNINFDYRKFYYKGNQLAFFRIFGNSNRPYLFKKDISQDGANIKKGTGFIRQGTRKRSLVRADFERIYSNKLQFGDRKEDLEISVNYGDLEEVEIPSLKFIDVQIYNKGKMSIEFDIEIRVQRLDTFGAWSLSDVKSKLREIEVAESPNVTKFYPNKLVPLSYIESNSTESEVIFRRSKLLNNKFAVRLAQEDLEKDVFNREVALLILSKTNVKFELIVRSDDFVDGALRRSYEQVFDK